MSQDKKVVQLDQSVWVKLKPLARERNQDIQELVQEILQRFLEDNQGDAEEMQERRRYRRKKIILPAMVYEKSPNGDMGRYFSSSILDVSIGGTRLVFPLDKEGRIEFLCSSKEFEIICYLPDSEVLSRFKCSPRYLVKKEESLQVGAAFRETDTGSFEPLSNFLSVEQT